MNSTRTLKSIIIALLIFLGISVTTNILSQIGEDLCVDYSSKEMNTLSAGVVHEIVNGYRDRQRRYIKSADPATIGTEAIWFDLETIKKFIYHLEVNSKSFDNSISSADLGLRFYYASYPALIAPQDPELGDLSGKGYEKRHTLVAIPTKRIGNEDIDFNPLDFDTYTLGLKATGKYDRTETDDSFNFRNTREVTALGPAMEESSSKDLQPTTGAQNHGNLYPPLGNSGLAF